MKKVCRKSAVKASPIIFFNFVKYLRQLMHAKDLKISYFKRHHGKVTWFSQLHPVSFYGQDYEKGGL